MQQLEISNLTMRHVHLKSPLWSVNHRYSTFVFTHITLIVLILLTAHYNIQVVWMTQLRIFLHKKLIFIIVCCVWKWRYNNTKYQNEVLEEEDKLKTTLRNPVINCSTLFVAWPACGNFEYDRWWVNLWPCLGLWWLQLRQMFPYKLLKFSDLNKCLDTDTNWIQTRGGNDLSVFVYLPLLVERKSQHKLWLVDWHVVLMLFNSNQGHHDTC